jgi:tetratricopeptide (TPR) repeat protein
MTYVRTWRDISFSTIISLLVIGLVGGASYYLWKNVAEDPARPGKQERLSSEAPRARAGAEAGVAADPKASHAEIERQLVRAYIKRGAAFHARGEDEQAIADYTKAIEINPKVAQAYTKRAVAHEAVGRREEAITDYRRALAIDGNQFSKDALKRLGASQ